MKLMRIYFPRTHLIRRSSVWFPLVQNMRHVDVKGEDDVLWASQFICRSKDSKTFVFTS